MNDQPFCGVLAPVLTPFAADLSPDVGRFTAFCRWLLAQGADGLAVFGTTSEANSQSADQRMTLLDSLIESGVPGDKLMPGTGACSIDEAVRLNKHAVAHGCGGVLMLPPFYYKGVSDDGLFAWFSEVVQRVGDDALKIYLYHIPQVSGVGLSLELVDALRKKYPTIVVGIKDSSGDWGNTKNLLDMDDFIVYPGSELQLVEAMKMGAPGCISATANLNSRQISDVIKHCEDENWDKAAASHEPVIQTRLVFQNYSPIPAQKALLAQITRQESWRNVRPPLMPLDNKKMRQLKEELDAIAGD